MPRMTVFNKDGYFIGDIRADPIYEYVKNYDPSPGRCEFSLSRDDSKCSLKYIEFGKYILMRGEGLPDWLGVIIKRTWNFGGVDVMALQVAHVLAKRNTPILKYKGSAGSLFTQIINTTNAHPYNEKPVRVGNVYIGGTVREETLGDDALTHLQDVAERTGNDFDITYSFDTNGRLYLVGNWYERQGIITNRHLREGHNVKLTSGVLVEDARELGNYVEGRGDASTTGTRIISTRFSSDSISRYGLNQRKEVFSGNKVQATLDNNTLNKLMAEKDPANTFDLTALNVNSLFDYLDVGNVFELDLNKDGFSDTGGLGTHAQVQILGMEYASMRKECRLVVERYTPDE